MLGIGLYWCVVLHYHTIHSGVPRPMQPEEPLAEPEYPAAVPPDTRLATTGVATIRDPHVAHNTLAWTLDVAQTWV